MAKRKRLTAGPLPPGFDPDLPETVGEEASEAEARPNLGHLSHGFGAAPPIARVAGESSAQAALDELSQAFSRAKAEGRLVQALPLESIDTTHLVRDRIALDEEELAHLIASIRDHGQRMPIDVIDLGDGRFGLISGWRRLTALQRLADETGAERFGTVRAILRNPADDSDAYVAMVEENEVRHGLSYYERARIAARAVDLGVFETEKKALQRLFSAASRARRSKIGSFLALVRALDDVLRFPSAIPERLGLSLAKMLDKKPEALEPLRAALLAHPPENAESEIAVLIQASSGKKGAAPVEKTAKPDPAAAIPTLRRQIRPGVFLDIGGGWLKPVLTISGPSVTPDFRERLERWLAGEAGK